MDENISIKSGGQTFNVPTVGNNGVSWEKRTYAASGATVTLDDTNIPAGKKAEYEVTTTDGTPVEVTTANGASSFVMSESDVNIKATLVSTARFFKIKLCKGKSLTSEEVQPGWIICSHGKAHAPTTEKLTCGGDKVAMVAYVGSDGEKSVGNTAYTHGLAIALKDASTYPHQLINVKLNTATGIETVPNTSGPTSTNYCKGIEYTNSLKEIKGLSNYIAVTDCINFKYKEEVAAGEHPRNTSEWFLPSIAQWKLIINTLSGKTTGITVSDNIDLEAVNNKLANAGGAPLSISNSSTDSRYWSSTVYYKNANDKIGQSYTLPIRNDVGVTSNSKTRLILAF